ncbi:MAG: S9 family peptidase, partial [Parachlamydiaceae bacterium]
MSPLTGIEYSVKGLGDFGTTNVEFDWSYDSQKIAFAYSPNKEIEAFYVYSKIAMIDLNTNEIRHFNTDTFESNPRFSPDGNWIGFLKRVGSKLYGINNAVAIRSIDGLFEKILSETPNGGPFLAGPNLLGWNKEGTGLITFEPKQTKFDLYLVPIDGQAPIALIQDKAFIREPSLSQDKKAISFVKQSPDTAPEVYFSSLEAFNPIRLSAINEKMSRFSIAKTEKIAWESEGFTIEGLLTYPKDYEPGKKYPLLLVIHGGPMGFFDESYLGVPFAYPIAVFSEEGYFILRTNPRGSTGYGKAFRMANFNDWGGKDMHDILRGVDYVIAQGFVDENRLGVMGWSYGGYMTSWIISQTNRFKAASM